MILQMCALHLLCISTKSFEGTTSRLSPCFLRSLSLFVKCLELRAETQRALISVPCLVCSSASSSTSGSVSGSASTSSKPDQCIQPPKCLQCTSEIVKKKITQCTAKQHVSQMQIKKIPHPNVRKVTCYFSVQKMGLHYDNLTKTHSVHHNQ